MTYHCLACELEWDHDTHCFHCEQPGIKGVIPVDKRPILTASGSYTMKRVEGGTLSREGIPQKEA